MPACQADRDPAVDVSLNPEPPDPVTGTDRIPECYDHTLSATGSGSGNPVVFTADPSGAPGACAVSGTNGSAVTYTGPGTCVIDANEAANNGYAAAAQVQQTITASSATMIYGAAPPAVTTTGRHPPPSAATPYSSNSTAARSTPPTSKLS